MMLLLVPNQGTEAEISYIRKQCKKRMSKSRDDFSAQTIQALAKRVAYICSNPKCKKLTIGPSKEAPDKTVSYGIAAHITAAATNGPRFDSNLTPTQRVAIENGIWLCSNCSIMIDRETQTYPADLLHEWKKIAENETRARYERDNNVFDIPASNVPIIDAELNWTHSSKWNYGVSPKNDPLHPIYVLDVIYLWKITWNYTLLLVNNSSSRAYNISVETNNKPIYFQPLQKTNHLEPLDSIELDFSFTKEASLTGKDASELMAPIFPDDLEGTELIIQYYDERRSTSFKKTVTITGGQANIS